MYDVAIVGGGIAGLAAAKKLEQDGLHVILLEARQRLGGLIYTESVAGEIEEHGAEFVHVNEHAILDILRSRGCTFAEMPADTIYASHSRIEGDDSDWATNCRSIKTRLAQYSGKAVSVASVFKSFSDSELRSDCLEVVANEVAALEGADESDLSFKLLAYDCDTFTFHQRVLGGYNCLVDALLGGYEVRTQFCVSTIRRYETYITVASRDNSQEVQAKHVIVALPIGVLQSNSIKFIPDLTKSKSCAIGGIGVNRTVKLVLRLKCDLPIGDRQLSVPGPIPTFWRRASNFGSTLVGFSGGRLLGQYNDLFADRSLLVQVIIKQLARLFGRDLERELLSWTYKDWSEDEFSRGSCSYSRMSSFGSDYHFRRELARPVANRIFFAGEATAYDGSHGTVHGAYDSGVRAASDVIQNVNKYRNLEMGRAYE